jgi:hypothetical protein
MVEFIEINGQKHPIIVNFYVVGLFQQETGKSFDSLTDIKDNLFLVEPLMWYALKTGYTLNKQEIPFTREEMPILLSDNDVYKNFTETLLKFFPTSDETQSSKKKKT